MCLDIPCGAALPFFNTSHGPSTELLDEVPTDHAWVKHAKEAMRAGNFPGGVCHPRPSGCETCCVFGSVAGGGTHYWYSTGYLWEKQVFGIAATWILVLSALEAFLSLIHCACRTPTRTTTFLTRTNAAAPIRLNQRTH